MYGNREKAILYTDIDIKKNPLIFSGHANAWCTKDKNERSHVYIGENLKGYRNIVHELMHAVLHNINLRDLLWGDSKGEDELVCYMIEHAVGTTLETKPKEWSVWTGKEAFNDKDTWKKLK